MKIFSEISNASKLTSRPDIVTEEIIEVAVQIAMEVGLSAAEEYLNSYGVSTWTSLRVLSQNDMIRRKPR